MDRSKSIGSSRSSKTKIGAPHHGSELYALGTKSSASRDDKNKVMSSVKGVPDRKRDTTALGPVPKKSKISSSSIGNVPRVSGETGSGASGSSSGISSTNIEPWEQIAIECNDTVDLLSSVRAAYDQQDTETITGLICGVIKLLSSSRSKIDNTLIVSLLYLCRELPSVFCNEFVTSALTSILKRDGLHAFKGRNNPTAHVIATNLLARAYYNKKNWPEIFVRLYIDDASGERVWVDNVDCAPFVENICTAFGTRIPPKSMLQPELNSLTSSTSQPGRGSESGSGTSSTAMNISIDDDSNDNSLHSSETFRSELIFDCTVQERYTKSTNIVEKYVIDTVKEQFNRRQQQDCSTRNFLKFLSSTTGIAEIRALSVSRLELWIHNQKLMKPAQELLTYICYNVNGKTAKDNEVLASLVKMRLKSKPLINIYMSCLKEMINLQPNILYIALKYVVQNELSNARNPNNMGMLATMFQTKPDQSAKHLAEIYQEFLLQREDCLRTLRVFLRELIKMLRYEFNLIEFCKSFLSNSRSELVPQIQQFEFKDRVFQQMVDLTCLCMFLTVSPQVREANVSFRAGRDTKNNSVLLSFYNQMAQIHLDALTWMHEVVPVLFRPQASEYGQALHKILLLDAPDQYSKCDQWPPEPERALLLRLISETPVHQDTILRIILIGVTKEIPFSVPDTIEVVEQTVKRASSSKTDYPAVQATKLEIIDFLFSMAEYHHPENIALPIGYEPPKLAISVLYWKVWNILLILSAHNPSIFGSFCWEQYPMLKTLMEMCITNQFHDMKMADEEIQVAALEKNQILEFEAHLAAATSKVVITEQNSLLLSQLMLMDPMGVARRPPNLVLEQLQQLNTSHKLGHLLCRSRKPDLLLDIIQRHGTTQSMPWLADLVQNSEGDFNHLPVQCLCEFLLSNSGNINTENTRDAELLQYLRTLLQDPYCDQQTVCEVLEYFLRRLSSITKQSRNLAINGLKLLLQVFSTEEERNNQVADDQSSSNWLLLYLPQIPHFIHARPLIIVQLRAACQIETNPELVMIYIQFIAAHTLHDPVPDMLEHVMDMAQLIVERNTFFQYIIPIPPNTLTTMQPSPANKENRLQTLNCLFVMFNNYLIKLREHKSPYEWTDYPDLLMVHFEDGSQLPIHLNIIHAFIILLTHSSSSLPNSIPILDYWFPSGHQIPRAFTIGTNEPIQLLPDWLKLKMIRSPVDRLVEAATYGLTPPQIVLFIQNFGTPVNSVSKLLALLDHAVMEQFDVVQKAIMNKEYLAELIEVQQGRGAKNGHITMQALELNMHSSSQSQSASSSLNQDEITILESVNLDQFQTILTTTEKPISSTLSKNSKEIEEIVDLLLRTPNLNKVNTNRFRRLIQQLFGRDKSSSISTATTTSSSLSLKHHQQQQQIQIQDSASPVSVQSFVTNKVLTHLMKIIKTSHGQYYFQNIFQKSNVCTLFRALFSHVPEKAENYNLMMQVIDKIIQIMSKHSNSDNAPVLQILINERKILLAKQNHHNTNRDLVKTNTEDFRQILMTAKLTELEKKGQKFLNDMINDRKTDNVIDCIIQVLNTPQIKQEQNLNDNFINYDKQGILIDWLSEVDSELIAINKEQQIDLLFNARGNYRNEFRFYMISLLCHQANWSKLYETVNILLDEFKPHYDPTAVLNFIEALIQNPKLWQGRDKSIPKHQQFEYILRLNQKKINTFTEYIFAENENYEMNTTAEKFNNITIKGSNSANNNNYRTRIGYQSTGEMLNSRINLLFKIVNPRTFDLRQLIKFVRNYRCNKNVKLKFLQQLYLMEPTIKFLDEDSDLSDVYQSNALALKSCRSDKIINYLITTIAVTPHASQQQKDQTLVMDAELLLRKFAASHPALFLRQLSVLSSLIQGKTHMSLNALRSENYLSRFLIVLRILEILQPLVFDDIYKDGVQTAMDCYFTLFKNHLRAKEVYTIMFRFIEFVQAYIETNPSSALIFIEQYIDLLRELTRKYRNSVPLHQLVQGLSQLKHKSFKSPSSELPEIDIKQEFDLNEQRRHQQQQQQQSSSSSSFIMDIDESSSSSTSLTASIPQKKLDIENYRSVASFALGGSSHSKRSQQYISPQFYAFINIIRHHSSEDEILQPLIEIENLTYKRSGYQVVDEIYDRLLELISSPSIQIRSRAYLLFIRYLKHNPGNRDINKSALNAYLQCLYDSNTNVATSALNNLVDIVVCLQEYASEILNTVFDLGITSRLNTSLQLKKCIQTLKLQHAS